MLTNAIYLFKWFLLVSWLSKLIPLACPDNDPQMTMKVPLKYSFDHNGNVAPQTWTWLAHTFDVGTLDDNAVEDLAVPDNDSLAKTPVTAGRFSMNSFSVSFRPQIIPDASHIALEDGYRENRQRKVWIFQPESDAVATGFLACCKFTSRTESRGDVREVTFTFTPRFEPDYDEAEPMTLP